MYTEKYQHFFQNITVVLKSQRICRKCANQSVFIKHIFYCKINLQSSDEQIISVIFLGYNISQYLILSNIRSCHSPQFSHATIDETNITTTKDQSEQ